MESRYGSGQLLHSLESHLSAENLVLSRIEDRDAILPSIKAFLGKGK